MAGAWFWVFLHGLCSGVLAGYLGMRGRPLAGAVAFGLCAWGFFGWGWS